MKYLIGLAAAALSACTKSVPVETMKRTTLVAPVQAPAGEPYLFSSAGGEVFLSWVRQSPFAIAESSDSRSSGFPQMPRSGGTIVFAWTDDESKSIKTAVAPL